MLLQWDPNSDTLYLSPSSRDSDRGTGLHVETPSMDGNGLGGIGTSWFLSRNASGSSMSVNYPCPGTVSLHADHGRPQAMAPSEFARLRPESWLRSHTPTASSLTCYQRYRVMREGREGAYS